MENKKNINSLVKRHVVAAIALPVLVSYLYFLPPAPYFMALLTVVAMVALWEFYTMYKVPVKLYVPGIAFGAVLFYLSCRHHAYFIDGIFISLFLLMLLRLLLIKNPSGSMSEIGPLGVGFFYIAGFLSFQWFLRTGEFGREYIFLLYLCVWLSDTMALYLGTYIGKNKLYPSISPNKTVEGAFGSVLGGIMGAVIVKIIFDIPAYSLFSIIIIGAILGISSMVGDLIESMFKRDAGVKDSGAFIPGHGGVLDKIDGMLISGPVLYLIVRYF